MGKFDIQNDKLLHYASTSRSKKGELLFYERQKEIITELEKLELED